MVQDPIHYHVQGSLPNHDIHIDQPTGWYFWDETWGDRNGPFENEQKAREELRNYCCYALGEKNMKTVVFLNGASGSGKDTLVTAAQLVASSKGWKVGNVSSIDCIRDLITEMKIEPIKRDSPEDRDFLASLGSVLEKYRAYKSHQTAATVLSQLLQCGCDIVFVHVRESGVRAGIEMRLKSRTFGKYEVHYTSMLVMRNGVDPITSNASDANVHDMEYDNVFLNNGSIGDMVDNITPFIIQCCS